MGNGRESLRKITIGTNNAAIGDVALFNLSTASHVVAIGRGAGVNVTTGSNSVFIGANTGGGITTGSGLTVIGNAIGGLDPGLTDHLILGTGNGIKLQADDTGTLDISGYGSGNKEAGDLSKTISDYIAVFSTDETLMELKRVKGIATTTVGAGTTLVITHNLGVAPAFISIAPGGDIGEWYVDTINTTTMTLNYQATATTMATSVNIYWKVE